MGVTSVNSSTPADALLTEFRSATVPVPFMRRDERALMGLPGMTDGEWIMLTLRPATDDRVELVELFTPSDWRGRGFGTEGLKWLTAKADLHHVTLQGVLRPFGHGAMSKRRLAEWYRARGFTVRPRLGILQRSPK